MSAAKRYFWGSYSFCVLVAAVIALLIDQVSKIYLVHVFNLQVSGPVDVIPFLNLVMVWNRGISYGLFQQYSEIGQIALTIVSFAASILLWIWSCRMRKIIPSVSLGLLIGGALGNGVDRAVYGAVVDFIHFHVGDFSWYVFNFADVFIVVGVVGLLYDSLQKDPKVASRKKTVY